MALKLALLAVVCFAQAFALGPVSFLRGEKCRNPALEIPYNFQGAMQEMDAVRETVTVAAMDAYSRRTDVLVVIACFQQERENYVKLGQRISQRIQEAAKEMAEELQGTAEDYAKLYEVPIRTIAVTMRNLPEKVYNLIKEKEFTKAYEALVEARKIVEENSRKIGQITQDFVKEVPELADRMEEMAREIREEAKSGVEVINSAFRKCVEEGGPKRPEKN